MKPLVLAAAFAALIGLAAAPQALASASAKVMDEVISAATTPPVKNDVSFKLITVDDQHPVREKVSRSRDARAKALVPEGEHVFSVYVTPVVSHPGVLPGVVEFRATVKSGATYVITGTSEKPTLTEVAVVKRQ